MRLGPKARSFLELLFLMGIDALEAGMRPRIALLDMVGWSTHRNFKRHLNEMRNEGWIDWNGNPSEKSWVLAITKNGKDALLENIDPEDSWSRPWDQKWRTLSFDLPQAARRERRQLDAWLRRRRFGHLQGSVWISHRPYSDWTAEIERLKIAPRSVLFQESVPLGRNLHADYVQYSWNFDLINRRYQDYLAFMEFSALELKQNETSLANWFKRERQLWKKAFEIDPFLPQEILPSPYKGRSAWNARKKAYKLLSQELTIAEASDQYFTQ